MFQLRAVLEAREPSLVRILKCKRKPRSVDTSESNLRPAGVELRQPLEEGLSRTTERLFGFGRAEA